MPVPRRGRAEDSICFEHHSRCVADPDDQLHKPCHRRSRASASLGFGPDGKRIRRTVTGQTRTIVIDKLRDLRREIDSGVKTRATYTVAECLDDRLTRARSNKPERTQQADTYGAGRPGSSLTGFSAWQPALSPW